MMLQIDQVLSRLRKLADEFPAEERPKFSPGASADSVVGFEKVVGTRLPEQLAHFLRQCDSIVAMDVWIGYWVGGVEQLLRSMGRKDFPAKLVEANHDVVVPVATDGGGNAFLMSVKDQRVWKWNHETGNSTTVAHDFASFLQRIADDWEHFLARDSAWHYLSG
jgi:hypothetical protein